MASTTVNPPTIRTKPAHTTTSTTTTTSSKPTKTTKAPFYSTSPRWQSITPIPLIDGPPLQPGQTDPGPALAAIAYSPRYSEAMSYLRAVMAANEFSPRALDLTEDIISMNPAHYTVWLYRAKCLQQIWQSDGTALEDGVRDELVWLEGISERNLKNYQIWHHRQLLLSLLPTLPADETEFLAHILSFDTKNYHVWSYRQWLCRQFPDPLLTTDTELEAMDAMIADDVRNNSAWNHRYFVCFGAEELRIVDAAGGNRKEVLEGTGTSNTGNDDNDDGGNSNNGAGTRTVSLVTDEDVVQREINYAKDRIYWAPQNPSPWNYLKGVLKRAGMPLGELQVFCEGFVGGKDGDLFSDRDVRSSHALDWLVEIYKADGNIKRSKACLDALGKKWDPVRRKYWEYRARQLDEE